MRRRRDENRFSMEDEDDEFLSFDSLEEYQEGAGAFGSDRDLRAIGICWLCIAVPSVFLFMFFPRAVDALGLSGGAPYMLIGFSVLCVTILFSTGCAFFLAMMPDYLSSRLIFLNAYALTACCFASLMSSGLTASFIWAFERSLAFGAGTGMVISLFVAGGFAYVIYVSWKSLVSPWLPESDRLRSIATVRIVQSVSVAIIVLFHAAGMAAGGIYAFTVM